MCFFDCINLLSENPLVIHEQQEYVGSFEGTDFCIHGSWAVWMCVFIKVAQIFFKCALVPDVNEQIYCYKTCINVALFMKESLFTFHPMTPKAKEVQNSKNRHFD